MQERIPNAEASLGGLSSTSIGTCILLTPAHKDNSWRWQPEAWKIPRAHDYLEQGWWRQPAVRATLHHEMIWLPETHFRDETPFLFAEMWGHPNNDLYSWTTTQAVTINSKLWITGWRKFTSKSCYNQRTASFTGLIQKSMCWNEFTVH